MVEQTSIESYQDLEYHGVFSERQEIVFNCIKNNPDRTDIELSTIIGWVDPNHLRPSRNMLMKKRKIYCTGKRPCSISGRRAMTWRVVVQGELF